MSPFINITNQMTKLNKQRYLEDLYKLTELLMKEKGMKLDKKQFNNQQKTEEIN